MSERFLDIDMLPQGNRVCSDHRVGMVRSGHDDSVDVLAHLVQHHPPVFETPGGRIVVERLHCIAPVHVAQGDDVLRRHILQVPAAYTADSHSRDVQPVTGSHMPQCLSKYMAWHDGKSSRSCRCSETRLDKVPSGILFHIG